MVTVCAVECSGSCAGQNQRFFSDFALSGHFTPCISGVNSNEWAALSHYKNRLPRLVAHLNDL